MVARATAPSPRRLHLEVTNRCNLLCTTCVRTAEPDADADLDVGEIARWAEALPELESVALQVNGEPLLHPRIDEIIELFARRGVRVELNTNGLLLDGARAEALLASGLTQLNVSIDGALPRTFGLLRGVDALDRVVANTERFLARRGPPPASPRVGLWVTCTRHNLAEVPALVELAARLGADELYLQRLVYFGALEATGDNSLHGRLTDEHRAILRDAEQRAARLGIALRASGGHAPADMFDPDREAWHQCRRPTDSAVVMADGDVVPCCISTFVAARDDIRMGNAREQSWASIWTGERFAQLRRDQARRAGASFCRGCGLHWSL